jgi:hypothetical protein
MKAIFTIAIIFLSAFHADIFCQFDDPENGAYRNHMDFNNNRPVAECDFRLIKKNNKKVPNLYRVLANDGCLKTKTIKKTIWGIYYNRSFYLNVEKLGMMDGFIKIDSIMEYSYFKGIPTMTLNQKERFNTSAILFGSTGRTITGITIAVENKDKIHYVLNMHTGMINLLTKDYLIRILEPFSELLSDFYLEENSSSIEVLLEYLEKLNKREQIKAKTKHLSL